MSDQKQFDLAVAQNVMRIAQMRKYLEQTFKLRPTKSEYLLAVAALVAQRGTCSRRRVGCVIATADGRIIATGYNGSAPGAPHCDESGHLLVGGRCVRTIHAEANALASAARLGIPTAGTQVWVTCRPCPACLALLNSAGVTRVVYMEPYHQEEDSLVGLVPGMLVEDAAEVLAREDLADSKMRDWAPMLVDSHRTGGSL